MFTRIANYTNKNEIIEAEKMIGAMNAAKLFEMSALDVYLICCEALGIHPKTHERLDFNETENKKEFTKTNNKDYSEDFKNEITAYAQMTTVSTAAKLYKVPAYAIRKWAKEKNLEMPSKGQHYSKDFKNKVVAYAAETTVSDASRMFDVTYGSIKNWCKEANVTVKNNNKHGYHNWKKSQKLAIAKESLTTEPEVLAEKYDISLETLFKICKDCKRLFKNQEICGYPV